MVGTKKIQVSPVRKTDFCEHSDVGTANDERGVFLNHPRHLRMVFFEPYEEHSDVGTAYAERGCESYYNIM